MLRPRFAAVSLVALLALLATAVPARAQAFEVDPVHSFVNFRIRHISIGYVWGRFNKLAGKVFLGAQPGDSKFELTIETQSVDTGIAKRDDHLRSPDFFNAREFPVIHFVSTKVEAADKGYNVTGDLTLHGQTHPLTFLVEKVGDGQDPMGNHRIGLSANVTLQREVWGIMYDEKMLGKDVHLLIDLEAIEPKK